MALTPAFIWIMVRLSLAIWLLTTALGGADTDVLSPSSRVLRAVLGFCVLLTFWQVQRGAVILGILLVIRDRRAASARAMQVTQ